MYRLLVMLLFFSQSVYSSSSMIIYDWSDYKARTTKRILSPNQRDINYTFLTALTVGQNSIPTLVFILKGAQRDKNGSDSPINMCDESVRDSFRSDDWKVGGVELLIKRTCVIDNETNKTMLLASTSHYKNIRYLIDKFLKGTDPIYPNNLKMQYSELHHKP